MSKQPNARTVFLFVGLAGMAFATAGILTCCEQPGNAPPPIARPDEPLPARPAPPAQAARGPKPPVQMVKPPTLGPVGPAIVVLPGHIAEPQIRVRLTDEQDRAPVIAKNKYRGRIDTLKLANGKYVAINVHPLDTYLQGVLSKELYGSWEPAAYRAQAIAARTYALYSMLTDGRGKQWDVNDDESSQMYGGIAGETAKSRAAVAATRGQVLMATVEGKTGIFCSRYSACIGGASQDPFEAWGDPSPGPLKPRVTGNVDENSDKFVWKTQFVASKADVTRCIASWAVRNSENYLRALGQIAQVRINKRNPQTSRPTELLLTDSAGNSAPIRAEEFRLALLTDPAGRAPKPYSSFFEIRAEGDAFVMYNGRGHGHGIGMSQWGAQNLAKQGQDHSEILSFFYPGSTLYALW
jgi:stage II sporulation protein D